MKDLSVIVLFSLSCIVSSFSIAQADFSLALKMYDDVPYEDVISYMESFEIRKVEEMMLEADAHYKLREYEDATDGYTQVLARDSYNTQALMRRGAVYMQTGEFGWALQDIKAALKITPMDSEANFYMGNLYCNQGDMRNAEKYYKAALEFRPDYAQAIYMLGAAKDMKGDKREAYNAFSSIMEEMPMAIYNLAVASLEANAYEVAFELFKRLEAHDHFAAMENAMDGDFFFMRAEAKYYCTDKQGACLDYKKAEDLGDQEAAGIYNEYCLKSKKKSDRKNG
jgi:Flp pilus assembly protein TadD